MKRYALAVGVALVLTGCAFADLCPQATTTATTAETTATTAQTTAATLPEHSELYIPETSQELVLSWFTEVCLDAEFVNSGDPSVVQKWVKPIRYTIEGLPTTRDLDVLEGFAAWLNTVEGFPGIRQTNDYSEMNLRFHFCDREELVILMGEHLADADGAMTFWYNDQNEIYDGVICICTDLDQQVRNSVILEELYNCLGPGQDTAIRPDSIIYSEYSCPQQLTAVDELILRLLYHPDMLPGMNAGACERVLRALYY